MRQSIYHRNNCDFLVDAWRSIPSAADREQHKRHTTQKASRFSGSDRMVAPIFPKGLQI